MSASANSAPSSAEPQPKKRLTVREARRSVISIPKAARARPDGERQDDATSSQAGEEMSEPGSPIFHNAIMFSNQIELNRMQRERRGGLRKAVTVPSDDLDASLHDQFIDMSEQGLIRRKTVI